MESSPASILENALFQASLGLASSALATLSQLPAESAETLHALILKGQLLLQLGQYSKAVDVLERVPADSIHSRLVFARALFLNQENERAIIEVQKLKDRIAQDATALSESEKKEFSQVVDALSRKVQLELTNTSRVGNINDSAYLPTSTKKVAAAA
jgi:tetratricopeptide (TPR) repeat protein